MSINPAQFVEITTIAVNRFDKLIACTRKCKGNSQAAHLKSGLAFSMHAAHLLLHLLEAWLSGCKRFTGVHAEDSERAESSGMIIRYLNNLALVLLAHRERAFAFLHQLLQCLLLAAYVHRKALVLAIKLLHA